MILDIEIPSQTEQRLREQAEAAGTEVRTYVSRILEQATARQSIDSLLAPLRKAFQSQNASDAQLTQDIESARAECRAEKKRKSTP